VYGLAGIEASSGKDVAGIIIEHLEKNAKVGKTKDRIQGNARAPFDINGVTAPAGKLTQRKLRVAHLPTGMW